MAFSRAERLVHRTLNQVVIKIWLCWLTSRTTTLQRPLWKESVSSASTKGLVW